jgi:hypothetical protein
MAPLLARMLVSKNPSAVCIHGVTKVFELYLVMSLLIICACLLLAMAVGCIGRTMEILLFYERESILEPKKLDVTKGECAICWEPLIGQTRASLKCKHVFHQHCADRWHEQNPTCALCRTPI